MTDLAKELSILEDKIADVNSLRSQITDKLQPILIAENLSEKLMGSDEKKETNYSPLVSTVINIQCRINNLFEQLTELNERIEL